jgi:hypothetical protein
MATEYGFIYILANECMPGIYKIGFTTNHPKVRAEQLSGATACPTPFEMVATFGTSNPRDVEKEIHDDLEIYRVNDSREFFRLDAGHALEVCRQYCDPYFDILHTVRLEELARREEREHEIAWKKAYFESQCADPIFWPERQTILDDDIPF